MPIDVSQVINLAGDLGKSGARVGAKVAKVTRTNGAAMQAKAKALAPRDTGALAASISLKVFGSGNSAAIGANVGSDLVYARYQEAGTAKMAPHPFLIPANEAQEPLFVADVEKAAEDIL
jgi:HK97 gp10 family phage protein